jgi:inhibitor of cysteine peptidase
LQGGAFVVACVMALGLFGCASKTPGEPTPGKQDASSVRITDEYAGDPVELAVGGTLVVELKENITTGYSWQLDGAVPDILKAVRDESKAAEATGVVGAGGSHVFEYSAVKVGEGELKLIYVRPWEKGVAPKTDLTAKIVVK